MSETSSVGAAVPLWQYAGETVNESLDTAATYRFSFASNRWFAGLSSLSQGGLMVGVSVFLLSQVSLTPTLSVQMSIVAALMAAGGLFFMQRSLADLFGRVTIGPEGFRARYGLSGFSVTWSKLKSWRVNDAAVKFPEVPAVEIHVEGEPLPKRLQGGYLSEQDQRQLRQLLSAFASGQQSMAGSVQPPAWVG